jgi:asparagine synthase (glutamine-hydrolysing)
MHVHYILHVRRNKAFIFSSSLCSRSTGSLFSHQLGTSNKWKFVKYYKEEWITRVPQMTVDLELFRDALENAVRSHLQCEVKFGALLSGGVDSSLIASIATKIMRERDPNFKLQTFSVGLKDAPDFKYSRMVAEYIDSDHHEVHFTVEEGLDCLRDIIYHLESYDVTTIRASIPMFIMMRYIKSCGLKMVLSGEGADEILGGYLYFHNAPNAQEFHYETVSRVLNLWSSDCLRANKSSLAWGVELRVPFLDTNFVNYAMSVRPEDRMISTTNSSIEKFILRKAFTDNYLPNDVLWRQKEQFSDGVGYNWIDTIRSYAASHVSDEEFAMAGELYPFNTPLSKEGFYYRQVFERIFPNQSSIKTVKQWIPRSDWGCPSDPSGRAQKVHVASKKITEI